MDSWTFAGTVVAPIVEAVASVATLAGLLLVWHQIRVTNAWNRVSTQHTLLSHLPPLELEDRVWGILDPYLEDGDVVPLKAASCKPIYEKYQDRTAVKMFLNRYEELCAAVNAEVLNDAYAYAVHGARVSNAHFIFQEYIQFLRNKKQDGTIYIELERTADRWTKRAAAEAETVRSSKKAAEQAAGVRAAV